jgi:hypothetical protein
MYVCKSWQSTQTTSLHARPPTSFLPQPLTASLRLGSPSQSCPSILPLLLPLLPPPLTPVLVRAHTHARKHARRRNASASSSSPCSTSTSTTWTRRISRPSSMPSPSAALARHRPSYPPTHQREFQPRTAHRGAAFAPPSSRATGKAPQASHRPPSMGLKPCPSSGSKKQTVVCLPTLSSLSRSSTLRTSVGSSSPHSGFTCLCMTSDEPLYVFELPLAEAIEKRSVTRSMTGLLVAGCRCRMCFCFHVSCVHVCVCMCVCVRARARVYLSVYVRVWVSMLRVLCVGY